MKGNMLRAYSVSGAGVCFDPQRFEKAGRIYYGVVLRYWGRKWIFIEPGETLIVDLNGEKVVLSGGGSGLNRDVLREGIVSEIAYYDIDPELLRRIYKTRHPKIILQGKEISIERYFSKYNRKNIKRFYKEYVIKK
jgi:hypothetical protein